MDFGSRLPLILTAGEVLGDLAAQAERGGAETVVVFDQAGDGAPGFLLDGTGDDLPASGQRGIQQRAAPEAFVGGLPDGVIGEGVART